MGAPDLKVEVYHILSFLLSYCSHHWDAKKAGAGDVAPAQALMEEVLLLTGYFCLLQVCI